MVLYMCITNGCSERRLVLIFLLLISRKSDLRMKKRIVSKHASCVKECFLSGFPNPVFSNDVAEGRRYFQEVGTLSVGVPRLLTE